MNSLDDLKNALLRVLPGKVSRGHGHKLEPPYIIWDCEHVNELFADDVPVVQIMCGQVGLYYKGENDDLISRIHQALYELDTCSCELVSNHYVEDLELNECLWDFEVV